MRKKLMLAIAILMASFKVYAQCDCNTNPKVWSKTMIYNVPNPVAITYTIKYYDCGGRIRIYDITYTTSGVGIDGLFIYANALDLFIKSLQPNLPVIQFEAQCGKWSPSGGQIGSGETGSPATFGLTFCTPLNSGCCEMVQFDMAQFLGMQPMCPIPGYQDCFLICQP